MKRPLLLLLLVPTFAAGTAFWPSVPGQKRLLVAGAEAGYLRADSCRPCHLAIYQTYQRTGMGRSFYPMRPGQVVEDWTLNNTYYHRASQRHYTMFERNGRYYQRRHQIGFGGKQVNVVEKEIHFVMGSGNHSRTYLHHSADGKLFELPVSWYSEKGGIWAMSPGYDSRFAPRISPQDHSRMYVLPQRLFRNRTRSGWLRPGIPLSRGDSRRH